MRFIGVSPSTSNLDDIVTLRSDAGQCSPPMRTGLLLLIFCEIEDDLSLLALIAGTSNLVFVDQPRSGNAKPLDDAKLVA